GVRDVYSLYQSDSNPATIYAGTNNGLFRSDDRGRNWTQVKKGAAGRQGGKTGGGAANLTQSSPSPHAAAKKTQGKAGAKSRKPSRIERDSLVDLQNQVFAISPFTPAASAPNSGEGDSQPSSTRLTKSNWMIASTWNGLFMTEDEKKGWREIKF